MKLFKKLVLSVLVSASAMSFSVYAMPGRQMYLTFGGQRVGVETVSPDRQSRISGPHIVGQFEKPTTMVSKSINWKRLIEASKRAVQAPVVGVGYLYRHLHNENNVVDEDMEGPEIWVDDYNEHQANLQAGKKCLTRLVVYGGLLHLIYYLGASAYFELSDPMCETTTGHSLVTIELGLLTATAACSLKLGSVAVARKALNSAKSLYSKVKGLIWG